MTPLPLTGCSFPSHPEWWGESSAEGRRTMEICAHTTQTHAQYIVHTDRTHHICICLYAFRPYTSRRPRPYGIPAEQHRESSSRSCLPLQAWVRLPSLSKAIGPKAVHQHPRLEGSPLLVRYRETRFTISCDSLARWRESHRLGEALGLLAL